MVIQDMHRALPTLLQTADQLAPTEVDIRSQPPSREWVNSLLMPTINFFLFDIQENTDLRRTGMQTSREGGQATHRMPPRRFDLRYMVSVITTEVEDEHLLLWRTLRLALLYIVTVPVDLEIALQSSSADAHNPHYWTANGDASGHH